MSTATTIGGHQIVGLGCRMGHHGAMCVPIDSRPLGESRWPIVMDRVGYWCSCDCHAAERDPAQQALM